MRVTAVVAPALAGGLAVLVTALVAFAGQHHSATVLTGVALLAVAAALAERFPVRLDAFDSGISVAFIFSVAAVVLFGWAAGVIVGVGTVVGGTLGERQPIIPLLFRSATQLLAAAASGVVADAIHPGLEAKWLAAAVAAAALAHHVVTISADAVAHSLLGEWQRGMAVGRALRRLAVPVPLMASAALVLVVLWQRAPALAIALIGPLAAIVLHNRATSSADRAMQLALTDSLTGLGNARAFQQRLATELRAATQANRPLALCLLDLDDFKRINDTHGHPVGDRVLAQLGTRFRQDGDAFRLGGDEFALLLPGHDAAAAGEVGRAVLSRIAGAELDRGETMTVSVGVAAFPENGRTPDALVRVADAALYRAKLEGKGRVVGPEGSTAGP